MIYFVQPVDGGAVKIGHSGDVPARLRQLEAHYGVELVLLAVMEGSRKEEAEIHSRFSDLRLGRTEQFQPGPVLMAFIGRPLLVGPNPEAVEAMEGPTALTIKGSLSWRAWVEGLARHRRTDVAKVVDAALTEYAEKHGYTTKPPDR